MAYSLIWENAKGLLVKLAEKCGVFVDETAISSPTVIAGHREAYLSLIIESLVFQGYHVVNNRDSAVTEVTDFGVKCLAEYAGISRMICQNGQAWIGLKWRDAGMIDYNGYDQNLPLIGEVNWNSALTHAAAEVPYCQ